MYSINFNCQRYPERWKIKIIRLVSYILRGIYKNNEKKNSLNHQHHHLTWRNISILLKSYPISCPWNEEAEVETGNRQCHRESNDDRRANSRKRRGHPLSTKPYLVTQLAYVGFKAPKERESTRDIEAWEPSMLSVRGKRLNAYEKRSFATICRAFVEIAIEIRGVHCWNYHS